MKLRFTNVINFLLINEVFLLKIRNTSKRNPLCILDEIYEFMAFWRKKKEITINNNGQFKDDGVFLRNAMGSFTRHAKWEYHSLLSNSMRR